MHTEPNAKTLCSVSFQNLLGFSALGVWEGPWWAVLPFQKANTVSPPVSGAEDWQLLVCILLFGKSMFFSGYKNNVGSILKHTRKHDKENKELIVTLPPRGDSDAFHSLYVCGFTKLLPHTYSLLPASSLTTIPWALPTMSFVFNHQGGYQCETKPT